MSGLLQGVVSHFESVDWWTEMLERLFWKRSIEVESSRARGVNSTDPDVIGRDAHIWKSARCGAPTVISELQG